MQAHSTAPNLIDSGPTDDPDRDPERQWTVLDGT